MTNKTLSLTPYNQLAGAPLITDSKESLCHEWHKPKKKKQINKQEEEEKKKQLGGNGDHAGRRKFKKIKKNNPLYPQRNKRRHYAHKTKIKCQKTKRKKETFRKQIKKYTGNTKKF